MGIKVWLDDERKCPEGHVHCKTAAEAIELLKTGTVDEISLDHDLGMEPSDGYDVYPSNGYHVAQFIERAAFEGTLNEIRVRVHTQNPVGRKNICAALQNAKKYWRKDV